MGRPNPQTVVSVVVLVIWILISRGQDTQPLLLSVPSPLLLLEAEFVITLLAGLGLLITGYMTATGETHHNIGGKVPKDLTRRPDFEIRMKEQWKQGPPPGWDTPKEDGVGDMGILATKFLFGCLAIYILTHFIFGK